jgi:spermidine/putrescine-binding protein
MNRRIAITGAAGLALVLALAPAALAGKTFSSQVKITGYNLGAFEGQVRSNFEKCEDKRGVELWKDNTDSDDSLIGDDKTDASGAWSVVDFSGGSFYAVARNKTGKYRKPNGKRKSYQCPEVTSAIFVR